MDKALPVTRCKAPTCQAAIVFARVMTTGNVKPFNAEPGPTGEWMISHDLLGDAVAEHLPEYLRTGNRLWTSHFATCPMAEEFRRRAKLGQA